MDKVLFSLKQSVFMPKSFWWLKAQLKLMSTEKYWNATTCTFKSIFFGKRFSGSRMVLLFVYLHAILLLLPIFKTTTNCFDAPESMVYCFCYDDKCDILKENTHSITVLCVSINFMCVTYVRACVRVRVSFVSVRIGKRKLLTKKKSCFSSFFFFIIIVFSFFFFFWL